MISCAFGMFCCMMKEFTVGMITSLLPFTIERWLLDRLQIVVGPSWLDAPYLRIASTWAGDTLSFTSGSRPSWRRCVRFRNSRPAAWPAADGLNLTASQTCSGGS